MRGIVTAAIACVVAMMWTSAFAYEADMPMEFSDERVDEAAWDDGTDGSFLWAVDVDSYDVQMQEWLSRRYQQRMRMLPHERFPTHKRMVAGYVFVGLGSLLVPGMLAGLIAGEPDSLGAVVTLSSGIMAFGFIGTGLGMVISANRATRRTKERMWAADVWDPGLDRYIERSGGPQRTVGTIFAVVGGITISSTLLTLATVPSSVDMRTIASWLIVGAVPTLVSIPLLMRSNERVHAMEQRIQRLSVRAHPVFYRDGAGAGLTLQF